VNQQIAFFKKDGSIVVENNPNGELSPWEGFYEQFGEQLHDVHTVRFNLGRCDIQFVMYTDGRLRQW
jgi:hypothetical protein